MDEIVNELANHGIPFSREGNQIKWADTIKIMDSLH